eukprot:8732638-Ditylum_brightwellii.AAC.2
MYQPVPYSTRVALVQDQLLAMLLLSGTATNTHELIQCTPHTLEEKESLHHSSTSFSPFTDYTDWDWNKVFHPSPSLVPHQEQTDTDVLSIKPFESGNPTHPKMEPYSFNAL